MTRQAKTLPGALDAWEDAIAGIERRVPKLERALAALEDVKKTTTPDEIKIFLSDINALIARTQALKERLA